MEDQLASLYCELELDGESPELHIEEGITNSSSSDEQGSNARVSFLQDISMNFSVYNLI